MGIASNATISPGKENASPCRVQKLQAAAGDDVGSQREQQASADLAGGSLGALGKCFPMTQLDIQTPDEHTSRRQFDHAIEPEGRERQASRTGTDCHGTLDNHPCNRQPLKAECQPGQRSAFQREQRRSSGGAGANLDKCS